MAAFDRAEHCRAIAGSGGAATLARYGRMHYRTIGVAGARATIAAHGYAYFAGLRSVKRWSGRRAPDLKSDLAAGQELAALDRAA